MPASHGRIRASHLVRALTSRDDVGASDAPNVVGESSNLTPRSKFRNLERRRVLVRACSRVLPDPSGDEHAEKT